jgi:hypothetical protein
LIALGRVYDGQALKLIFGHHALTNCFTHNTGKGATIGHDGSPKC